MEIFKVLGTPDENYWPELTKHKHYSTTIPKLKGTGLKNKVANFLD